jgi:hypothetical protein
MGRLFDLRSLSSRWLSSHPRSIQWVWLSPSVFTISTGISLWFASSPQQNIKRECIRFEFLSDGCMRLTFEFISGSLELLTFGIFASLGRRLSPLVSPGSPSDRLFLPPIDSKTISTMPEIFSMFRDKRLKLLWLKAGSQEGFQAARFHSQCNGY